MSKYIKLEDAIHNINLEVTGRKEYTGDMKANLFFALDDLPTIDREMKYYKAGDVDLVCIKNFANGDVLSAIRNLPTIEVSEDCISKGYLEQEIENQAMTVEKDKEYWRGWNNALDKVVELIENAPSVVPTTEQSSKVGEWELASDDDGEYGICSICGNDADFTHYGEPYRYCPNCGAKMKGAENE